MYVGLKTVSNDNKLFIRLIYHLNIAPKAGKHYSSFQGEGMKVVCLVWGGVRLASGQPRVPDPAAGRGTAPAHPFLIPLSLYLYPRPA